MLCRTLHSVQLPSTEQSNLRVMKNLNILPVCHGFPYPRWSGSQYPKTIILRDLVVDELYAREKRSMVRISRLSTPSKGMAKRMGELDTVNKLPPFLIGRVYYEEENCSEGKACYNEEQPFSNSAQFRILFSTSVEKCASECLLHFVSGLFCNLSYLGGRPSGTTAVLRSSSGAVPCMYGFFCGRLISI